MDTGPAESEKLRALQRVEEGMALAGGPEDPPEGEAVSGLAQTVQHTGSRLP